MKTVLIYVISSPLPPYPKLMEAQMMTWDSVPVEGVETLFYCNKFNYERPNVIQFDIPDRYDTMGKKNLMAFRWALDNRQWDYMARVNSSCYVRKKKLSEYVQTLPPVKLFRGVGVCGSTGKVEWLWGGGQYIMSRDVVAGIVANEKFWNHATMEDIAISQLATLLGVPLDTTGRCCGITRKENHWICIGYEDNHGMGFEFFDFADMRKAENQHFIRVKQDLQRDKDIEIMQRLHGLGI